MAGAQQVESLKQQLSVALGWDPSVVEGVVNAVVSAASEHEVEDVITNFMGDDPTARQLVTGFRARQREALATARKGGQAAGTGSSKVTAQGAGRSGSSVSVPLQEYQQRGPAGTRQSGAIHARMAKPSAGKRGKGKGVTLNSAGQLPAVAEVVRQVVNCLSCGKIFDCREVTTDTKMFLESKGRCTFCGELVPSLYGHAPADPPGPREEQDSKPMPDAAAEAAALDLKDRLVEYDRNSASRTSVIDDQSDYFAIESNVWLDESERRALAERQAALEQAEGQRDSCITVAVDLMGRKVVLNSQEDRECALGRPGSMGFHFGESETERLRRRMAEAAEATAEEIPQGGGSAVRSSALAEMSRTIAPWRSAGPTRITVNPDLNGGPSLLFLPRDQDTGNGKQGGSGQRGKEVTHRQQNKERQTGLRLQHDDPSVEMAGYIQEPHQRQVVDICGQDIGSATPRPGTEPREPGKHQAKASKSAALSEGLVLLKGWLSMETQAEIVRTVRELGVGPGGFYTPSYTGGGQLRLKMMCLGKHWEPRTAQYEDTRSSYDGAEPPSIPQYLLELVHEAVATAQAIPGAGRLPPIHPDICLCNFYEKSGRLGMHQDRDESQRSLRAGIPVVSFSIGDSADFVYGKSRDEAQAEVVKLDSGDVLVFGGPSRMLFHGVPGIQTGTAPRELTLATKLVPGRLNLTFRQL